MFADILMSFHQVEINQALKLLLKWVLENYPKQLREHLNIKEDTK